MGTSFNSKEALLRCAIDRLIADGPDKLALEAVRRDAGVSNGSLYHHFNSREQLLSAVHVRALARYHEFMRQELAVAQTARSVVRGLVARHIDWVLANQGFARLLDELPSRIDGRDGSVEAEVLDLNRQAFGELKSLIEMHTVAGQMKAMPFEVWMALVLGPVMLLGRTWIRQGRKTISKSVRAALCEGAWHSVAQPLPESHS